jgi:hypothetical protein
MKFFFYASILSFYGCQTQFVLKNTVPSNSSQQTYEQFQIQKLFLPSVRDNSSTSGVSGFLTEDLKKNLLLSQKYEFSSLKEAYFAVEVSTRQVDFKTTGVSECIQNAGSLASQAEDCSKPSSKDIPSISAEKFISTGKAQVKVTHLDTGKVVLNKQYENLGSAEFPVVAPLDKQPDLKSAVPLHALRFSENQSFALKSLAQNISSLISADIQSSIQQHLKSGSQVP